MSTQRLHGASRSQQAEPLATPFRSDKSAISGNLPSPEDPAKYCAAWLDLQCRRVPGVGSALLMVFGPAQRPGDEPITIGWPHQASAQDPALQGLAEQARHSGEVVLKWAQHATPDANVARNPRLGGYSIAVPIGPKADTLGVVVLWMPPTRLPLTPHPDMTAEQLRWGAGWLEAIPWVRQSKAVASEVDGALACLDLVVASGEHSRLQGAAIAIANELATRLKCDRVSLGLQRRNGSIRLTALSHSVTFKHESRLVEAIESAMDEAVEQGRSLTHPAVTTASQGVAVSQCSLAGFVMSAGASVLTVPFADAKGVIIGALTLERHDGPAFDEDTVRLVETMAAVTGPIVALHRRMNRFVTGRAIESLGETARAIAGPRRPALKLAALGLAGLIGALAFAKVEHRVTARSVIEAEVQRAAVAPFDGFIHSAPVRAGAKVKSGDLLAALDDRELLLDRAKWSAEHEKLLQKQREALSKRERTTLSVVGSQVQQAAAQLALAEEKLARARILAPFDGIVVSGDLSQSLGSPVEKGKVLFEVAPADRLRVIVHVDERDVRYTFPGQPGAVTLTGMPWSPLPIVVTAITPVTVAEDGRNSFLVEARLNEADARARPGMEGIAKMQAGRRPLLWVWSHGTIEALGLMAWKYLP